jgi:hypothetical protein
MRYSVYNHTLRAYDYYDAPGPGGTHAGSPPAPRSIGDLGAPPERAAWKLPVGARKAGSGALPQGRIASLGSDLPSLSDLSDPSRVLAYAALAYVAWRILR